MTGVVVGQEVEAEAVAGVRGMVWVRGEAAAAAAAEEDMVAEAAAADVGAIPERTFGSQSGTSTGLNPSKKISTCHTLT